MKKIIFATFVLLAFVGLFFVSCEKDDSSKHEYTQEELDEIARQDSLKQIIPADYIYSIDITVPISKGYDGVVVTVDSAKLIELFEYTSVAEIATALGTLEGGVQAGNEITFFAYNYSTKYEVTNPSTTNYFGHWFDANGDVCSWGDQAYLFCEKVDTFSLDFRIGLFPDRPTVGNVYKIVEAMKYDQTTVAFLFNVTIAPEEVVEVPVTTLEGTQNINIEAEKAAGWVDHELEFDSVTIANAIGCDPKEAIIYGVNSDGSLFDGGYTANNGFWFNRSGEICSWGSEAIAMYMEYRTDAQRIGVGQMPDSCFVGETYSAKLAFVNLTTLKQYNVVVNMTITEPTSLPYPETTLETTINLAFSADSVATVSWIDHTLALDTAAIIQAIGASPAAATIYGVNQSDDLLRVDLPLLTANNGCWFDANGNVCTWGGEGITMYVEYRADTKEIGFGQYPGACVSGQTYYGRLAFVNDGKRAEVKVALTIK
ncbi:MAG: DUF4859 domain-containing protein [Bacteroidales bacterium]|nr:DUF4859 domain-containing protein [Bacteroidales bacterium]